MYPIRSYNSFNNIDHPDWIVRQARRLMTNDMSEENQRQIISALAAHPLERIEFIVNQTLRFCIARDYNTLIVDILSNTPPQDIEHLVNQSLRLVSFAQNHISDEGRAVIIGVLHRLLPQERELFIDQALRLITNDMTDLTVALLISMLSKIPQEERQYLINQALCLITVDTSGQDKIDIISILSKISEEDREFLLNQTFCLITVDTSGKDRTNIFYILSTLSQEDRELIIDQLLFLITIDMSGEDRRDLLYILSKISQGQREFLMDQACRLMDQDTPGKNRAEIIRTLFQIPQEEIKLLVDQALFLMAGDTSGNYTPDIIGILCNISQDQREFFLEQAYRLFTDDISGQDKLDMIHMLSYIPIENIEFVITQILIFINNSSIGNEERVTLIREEMIRLLNKKFMVTSGELIENPIKVILTLFEMIEGLSIELLPSSIEYTDSTGIDEGGITRSFVSTLTESFCNQNHSLLINNELGVIPTLDTNGSSSLSLEDQEKIFKIIGRFFSAALQQYASIVVGQHFHPIVFEMIVALNKDELVNKDSSEVFDKLLKICIVKEFKMGEELAENLIRNTITEELTDVYCIDSKEEFIKEYDLDKKIKATLIIAKSIYDSLLPEADWDTVKGNSSDALREKIQGSISRDTVKNALQIDEMENANATSFEYITKWITGTNSEMLQKFIEAISGMKTLPSTTQLSIAGMSGIDKLPLFHTCFFRMDLSQYSSYEAFKEKLETSLDYCLAGSGFQMG